MTEKILTGQEALQVLADNIEEESARADAYRDAAISLIDHIANEMVFRVREEQDARDEAKKAAGGKLLYSFEDGSTN